MFLSRNLYFGVVHMIEWVYQVIDFSKWMSCWLIAAAACSEMPLVVQLPAAFLNMQSLGARVHELIILLTSVPIVKRPVLYDSDYQLPHTVNDVH